MQSQHSKQFANAIASIVNQRPVGNTTGSRILSNCRKELALAVRTGATDMDTLKGFRKLGKNNPLYGYKTSTAIQYIASARLDMGLRKNKVSK